MAQLKPGSYLVAFTSRLKSPAPGYDEMSQKMVVLASKSPGFLGFDSVRDDSGKGITLSYWESLETIQNWKKNSNHLIAQAKGRSDWYQEFQITVSKIERISS